MSRFKDVGDENQDGRIKHRRPTLPNQSMKDAAFPQKEFGNGI